MKKTSVISVALATSVAALVFALPASGQNGPESLLPSDFKDPAAPPPAAPPPPTSSGPDQPSTPSQGSSGGERSNPRNSSPGKKSASGSTGSSSVIVSSKTETKPGETESGEPQEYVLRFDVPPSARRSLKQVGLFSSSRGGFPETAFGGTPGSSLINVIRKTQGPLASRWGTIMGRRLLASRANTPEGISGADWAAERAWLLLRMGDADTARQLLQQVDSGSYSKRLYEVAMPVYLANADLSGFCPLSEGGKSQVDDAAWNMSQVICASLAGEQGRATALLNQARKKKTMVGIDLLLAEKAVGAGMNGRRSVKIEWDKVGGFNAWRFGLALATGVEPPAKLYQQGGRHVDAWRAQLPMLAARNKILSAENGAALGVVSNAALVDLYGQAFEDEETPEAMKTRAEQLQLAYVAGSDSERLTAIRSIWDGGSSEFEKQAALVLTARAAALVSPSSASGADADRLIASMMSAGLDNQAAEWGNVVASGSPGWAQLVTGAPELGKPVSYGSLDDFYDDDQSENGRRSAFLLAGLAGLGRLEPGADKDFAEKLDIDWAATDVWTNAVDAAASRGEAGTVGLLALAALQGNSWKKVLPVHMFHMIAAMKSVGLEAEARMIAAEAVVNG